MVDADFRDPTRSSACLLAFPAGLGDGYSKKDKHGSSCVSVWSLWHLLPYHFPASVPVPGLARIGSISDLLRW